MSERWRVKGHEKTTQTWREAGWMLSPRRKHRQASCSWKVGFHVDFPGIFQGLGLKCFWEGAEYLVI